MRSTMEPTLSEGVGQNGDGPGGIPTKTEQTILQKLLYDEGEFLDRLEEIVERAMKFLRVEPRTGRVVLTDDSKRRKVQDQIRLLLAGRYFAWKLGVLPTDKMNYREIAVELDRPPHGISSELSELVRNGDLVRDEDGLASMPFHRIDGTLREVEQTRAFGADDNVSPAEPVRRNGTKRPPRQRSDPVVQAMLEKPVDLSEYAWIKELKTGRDKGLAALMIAADKYNESELTCQQMATFLTRTFPIKVTRGAINMGFLDIKSQYVAPVTRGGEIAYTLLPLGRAYIEKVASQVHETARVEATA